MTDRVQIQSVATFDAQPVQSDGLAEEHGIYQGQEAQTAPDAQSLIQDSAEELTFGMAEVVEKKVTTRKMGKKGELDQRLIEMLRKLEQVVPDMNRSEKMSRFMAQLMKMLKNGEQPGSDALRQLARQFFEDPTEQFAALDAAREWCEGEDGGEALAKAAGQALKELDQEAGPAIRAGFNISRTAAEMAQGGLADIQSLRDLYRAKILGFEDIVQTFEALEKEYGANKFTKALEFLLRAISADIESQKPSIDPVELKAVHDDLFFVRLLGQMQDELAGLIGRMKNAYGERVLPSAGNLMKSLIGLLKQQYVSESHFRTIVEQTGLRRIDSKIDFLREWNKNIKRLPLKMYARQDQREKLLGAGQIALDALVAEEEGEAEW